MASSKVILVNEAAPYLEAFDGPAVRKHLRDFAAYQNRLGASEVSVSLCRTMDPEDLDSCIQTSEDMRGVKVLRRLPEGEANAKKRKKVLVNLSLMTPRKLDGLEEEEKKEEGKKSEEKNDRVLNLELGDDEVDDDAATVVEGEKEVLYLSDAYVEMMLIHALGPRTEFIATGILRSVKMSKEPAFARLSIATNYVRDWKDALRWCSRKLPREKVLVEYFLENVIPKKLGYALKNAGCRKIQAMFKLFLDAYREAVDAQSVVTSYGGQKSVETEEKAGGSNKKGDKGSSSKVAAASSAGTMEKKGKGGARSPPVCYHCNKQGHIRPNCPDLKSGAEATPAKVVRQGAVALAGAPREGPYLAVDVSAGEGERMLRLMAYMDSGAVGGDIVGRNWVAHLELHGGIVEPLAAPCRAQWLDSKVQVEVRDKIDMSVLIAGTDVRMAVSFLVAPWDIDHVVIGWNTMVKYSVIKRLEELMALQCSLGVSTGVGSSNDVQEITDVDGQLIKTDEFLFCDESPAAVVVPETVLSAKQSVEVEVLLDKYSTVFDDKPAGSALVEPMVVTMMEGWTAPPLESFRKYAPRVELALQQDLDKQVRMGVIEESKSMWGCPVHAVPKPDSESGYRFCIDFRLLNAGAVVEQYPLPTVSSVLASLAGCKFFAKLDLRNGYWQFPVHEKSRHLLAFTLWGKMWQYRVVPMGFKGSSFYTQRAMYGLFADRFGRGVLVYLDDVIIYAVTFEEFLVLLDFVLGVMLRANLACKRSKCVFGMREIQILGHVVSEDGVRMDAGRIDAVLAVPFPRNARELRRFLGMTNYMRAFVPQYSLLAKPLTQEVNNPVGEWSQEVMWEAFEKLKKAVSDQLILSHLDCNVPIVVQCDALAGALSTGDLTVTVC